MAGASFSSIGSGIDFSAIADAIVAQSARPIVQLQSKRSQMSGRSDALKQLNAKLVSLTEATRALTDQNLGSGMSAISSNSTTLTASVSGTPAAGTHVITVDRLATSLAQASRSYATTTTSILAGGATEATFELRKGGAASGTPITITAANDSLEGLRDAINDAKAGVTASIVDVTGDGTGNQLVLNSTETGAAGRVELVETTATGTGADLTIRTLNPAGAPADFNDLNASLTINGLAISRSTNTVSDALDGVSLTLKEEGTSSLKVSQNTSAIEGKLIAFVDAYNAVVDFAAAQYAPNSAGQPGGILAGDSTLRSVQQQLRNALNAFSTANGGSLSSLTEIGLGRSETGKLTLDKTVLNDKISTSFADVQALLSGADDTKTGLANSILAVAEGLSDSVTGQVQKAIDGYKSSIAGIDKSIAAQQERLEALRASLKQQFAIADAAIGQLNGQGSAVSAALKALEVKPRD